jgi:hypothetical protein
MRHSTHVCSSSAEPPFPGRSSQLACMSPTHISQAFRRLGKASTTRRSARLAIAVQEISHVAQADNRCAGAYVATSAAHASTEHAFKMRAVRGPAERSRTARVAQVAIASQPQKAAAPVAMTSIVPVRRRVAPARSVAQACTARSTRVAAPKATALRCVVSSREICRVCSRAKEAWLQEGSASNSETALAEMGSHASAWLPFFLPTQLAFAHSRRDGLALLCMALPGRCALLRTCALQLLGVALRWLCVAGALCVALLGFALLCVAGTPLSRRGA